MIELCSRRRMVACIIGLICVTILVVILESWLTSSDESSITSTAKTSARVANRHNNVTLRHRAINHTNSGTVEPQVRACWQSEQFSVASQCRPCSVWRAEFAKDNDVCALASTFTSWSAEFYAEQVLCLHSQIKVYRPCVLGDWSPQLRAFWSLHVACALSSLLSGCVVWLRRRQLSRAALRRIQQQIAAGV